LHYVLDVWFAEVVPPCLKGRAFLVVTVHPAPTNCGQGNPAR
jgi:hypothetical protein